VSGANPEPSPADARGIVSAALRVRRLDFRLLSPAASAWVAAMIAVAGVPVAVPVALWSAAAFALLAATLASRRARVAAWLATGAVCLAAAALVTTVAGLAMVGRHPPVLSDLASDHRSVSATVVTTAAVDDGRVEGTLVRVAVGEQSSEVSTPTLVFLDDSAGPAAPIRIGTTIQLRAGLAEAASEEDVGYLAFASGELAERAPAPWFLEWGNDLRAGFAREAASLDGDGGDLLPGLAIGDTSAVDDSLDAAMKASSLSHLTAVSGANCAIVVGLVMAGGAALRMRRGVRVGVSVVVLLGFVVLVTPEPSVLRAAVMAVLVLVALASGRPLRGMPVLAVAVLCLVATDPWLSRDYGFVLSVLATGALLTLAAPLARVLARFLPASLAMVIAVPLAAQLACQPVLILLSSTIPTYGVVANLLAEPAAPIATVLGLLACVALPFVPALGSLLVHVAWLPAAWIAAVARFFPELPGAQLPWLAGAAGLVLLAMFTALVVVAVIARPPVRRVSAFAAVVLASAVIAAMIATTLTVRLSRPPDWQIAACDIGQGDAVLVRSLDQTALVDTGPDPELLASCLSDLGIDHLDLLVLTHYDLDHVGGLDAVLGTVSTALVGPTDGEDDERVRRALEQSGAAVMEGSRGMSGLLGELRWTLLWPRAPLAGVAPGNDASLTMTFRGAGRCADGCLSSLFLGDLGQESQALVLAAGAVPRVQVVKVAHHGSADQDTRIYGAASAVLGIISVGADNTYGHPTAEALELLEAAGTAPVRTDVAGMVLVSPGAEVGTIELWTSNRVTTPP